MPDNTPRDLANLVLAKIVALGDTEASKYFEMSMATILAWRTRKTPPSLAAAQRVWTEDLLCQAPEVWGNSANAEIQLLLPAYEAIAPLTFVTLFRACKLYGMDKINIIPKIRTLVMEARNDLAARALLTKSEWFIYVDADGVFPCGSGPMLRSIGLNLPEPKASRNAIQRIMSHPKEFKIIGALYKDRRGGTKAQCESAFRSPQENERLLGLFDGKGASDGLEEVGWTGFSLVRIHRSVFEDMAKAAVTPGSPLFDSGIAPPKGREKEPFGFFGRSAKFRGEDVFFCRHAAMAGAKTFVDTGILCGHLGQKIY